MNLTFIVPGQPVPWARARQRGSIRYTDPKVAAYKRAVGLLAASCMGGRPPATGPVVLELRAVMEIPASWSRVKRERALAGEVAPIVKPDWDNLAKGVSDALNGVAYQDDAQVVRASVEKVYGAEPKLVVNVMGWST